MKKLILSLVFVLAAGTTMNASSSNIVKDTKDIEIVEDFGCRGDCKILGFGIIRRSIRQRSWR